MQSLKGVRVLDLTRLLPGPFATLVLVDLGAQVDKVEDPGAGDYARNFAPSVQGTGAMFHILNRGKRNLVLNLKHERGPAVLRRLVKHYDVLVEQFRPGVMDRLGVGHDTLLSENERLVICALTGYGQTGPLRDRAGHDLNYLARSGLLGLQGPSDGAPQIPSFQLADVSGGLWSVIGILSALRQREQSGKGGVVDIAMLDSVIPFATVTLSRLLGGELPTRGDELLTGGIAPYASYMTADGQAVTLGALEPKFLFKFCQAVGLEVDGSVLMPGPHQAQYKQRFAEIFAGQPRAHWEKLSLELDCCLEPVLMPEELLQDEQLKARGVFFELPVGNETIHAFRTPVSPQQPPNTPAASAGAHSDSIFKEAGFEDSEIAKLRADRVIS